MARKLSRQLVAVRPHITIGEEVTWTLAGCGRDLLISQKVELMTSSDETVL